MHRALDGPYMLGRFFSERIKRATPIFGVGLAINQPIAFHARERRCHGRLFNLDNLHQCLLRYRPICGEREEQRQLARGEPERLIPYAIYRRGSSGAQAMAVKSNANRYGAVAIVVHWLTGHRDLRSARRGHHRRDGGR